MNISRDKINEIIKKRGLKKGYIAKRMNMSAPTLISRLKKPESFTIDELENLASTVGVSISEFFENF